LIESNYLTCNLSEIKAKQDNTLPLQTGTNYLTCNLSEIKAKQDNTLPLPAGKTASHHIRNTGSNTYCKVN